MRRQKGVPPFAIFFLVSTALPAFGQSAFWNGGNGNWSNASNWGCNCVPSAGYEVYIGTQAGSPGTVTLDVNASVGAVFAGPGNGAPGGSMIIAGTSLTTTEQFGLATANFANLTVNSGGSVTTPNGLTANTLIADHASLNTGVQATAAVITNGSVINSPSATGLSLEIDNGTSSLGSLTLLNSMVGPKGGIVTGGFSIGNSTVHGLFSVNTEAPSKIVGSGFDNFGGVVNPGGSLDIQQSTLNSAGGGLSLYGGTATLEMGTTYQGPSSLNVRNGTVLTLDGAGTAVTLSSSGSPSVEVDSTSEPSVLNVQNGAKLLDGGNTRAQLLVGNGTLNILSGGQVSTSQVNSTAGTILVSGAGSSFTSSLINLGGASASMNPPTGVLLVQNGGAVNAGTINLGVSGGGGGELSLTGGGVVNYTSLVAVNGPSSVFEGGGIDQTPIYVGSGSSLTGAAQQSADNIAVDATVTGSGSVWQPKSGLDISAGTLTIADGGTLNTATAFLRATDTGAVKVTGSGSTLSTGDLYLLHYGSLNILNGGVAAIEDGGVLITNNANLQVMGAGSKLTVDGGGGNFATSTFDTAGSSFVMVSNGGVMKVSGNPTDAMGNQLPVLLMNDQSTVTVTGAGSQMTVASTFGGPALADYATLNVQNQGTLSVVGALTVGSSERIPGQLNINQGGIVTANSVAIALGSVTISSEGQLSVSGPLTVGGGSGTATLTISGSGQLTGVQDAAINALGTLSLAAGASATIGSRVAIGSQGTVDVTSGSLNIGTVLIPQGQGWVTVGFGGTLSGCSSDINCVVNNRFIGSGNVNGGVAVQAGGRVSPGDPESFNISGNYLQTGGDLDLEIDGMQDGEFDKIIAGGSITFTGGTIDFVFGNGFAPGAGETFDLMSAAGGISLNGTNFLIEGLAPGFDYSTSFANGEFELTALNDGISSGGAPPPPPSAPEPATWGLMASALILLPLLSRLRKASL
ncbi:MAG TPA: hypothetical protein VFA65_00935 [Bryobacteraceae bacterium]|nr:hypothetical protein [Bryobacteraceae bacterium]